MFFSKQAIPDNTTSLVLFGSRSKSDAGWAQGILSELVQSDSFVAQSADPGKMGTHGLRKGAVTFCSQNKVPKDHTNTCGWWSRGGQMINTYKDLYLPVPDAQVARALTGPKGPAQYKIKEEKVSDNFLKDIVAPHTFSLLGSKVETMLACALLFAVCNSLHLVPCAVVTCVKRGMEALEIPVDVNPVDQFPIAILNDGGDLCIKPMVQANAPLAQPSTTRGSSILQRCNNMFCPCRMDWLI